MLDAVNHRMPEQIPSTLYLDDKVKQDLLEVAELRDPVDGFEDDTVRILWDMEAEVIDAESYLDPFGIRWLRAEGMHFYMDPPLKQPDISKIPRVKLVTDTEVERILLICRENPDKFVYYQFHMTFGERL